MSELKARTARSIADEEEMLELGADCPIEPTQVYIKSEADKVIANRDYEIKNLKDLIGKLLRANTEQIIHEVIQKTLIYGEGFIRVQDAMKLIAELRHNKFKRCLAMAKWCESEAYIHEHGSEYDEDLVAWFGKWYKRWLELAKKLKEAK